jgi:hypothetical protein
MSRKTVRRAVARVAAVLGLSVTMAVVATACTAGAVAVHDHALSRCAATPPGFPERLSTGAVAVDWGLDGYTCVYRLDDGQVVRRPPA